ncbi:MAG: tetratricopeptide repeat protein [Pseudomonadota bacterium]
MTNVVADLRSGIREDQRAEPVIKGSHKVAIVAALGALMIGLTINAVVNRSARTTDSPNAPAISAPELPAPGLREATPDGLASTNIQRDRLELAGADLGELAGAGAPTIDPEIAKEKLEAAYAALVAERFEEALTISTSLAASGNAEAQHLLGFLYEDGLGVEKDVSAAEALYAKSAAGGFIDGQVAYGSFLLAQNRSSDDIDNGLDVLGVAADRGDPRALVRLGVVYTDGIIVPRDEATGLAMIEKAASQNDPDALFFLGMAHVLGKGKPVDAEAGRKLLSKAAEGGQIEAAYNLALLYRSQDVPFQDKDKSLEFLEMAAASGHGPAMRVLGLLAHAGEATGAAADWFESASEADDLEGRFLYAVALFKGDGRDKDLPGARSLAENVATDPRTPPKLRSNVNMFLSRLDTDGVSGPLRE